MCEYIKATIGYLVKNDMVLLVFKKRGFGKGLYNGFGGKLEQGENWEQALIREAREELNVTPTHFYQAATLEFYDDDILRFHTRVYIVKEWEGEPQESEEVRPQWFNKHHLPYDNMWADDVYWLPHVLNGKHVNAQFTFKGLMTNNPILTHKNVTVMDKV